MWGSAATGRIGPPPPPDKGPAPGAGECPLQIRTLPGAETLHRRGNYSHLTVPTCLTCRSRGADSTRSTPSREPIRSVK
ncbi:hypothetical protein ACTI_54270 [Actinoplanes sp. OR16]|nr:hypothetical protein ACTI_54270 [Actinoplanes sp. OR16]